MGNVARLDKSTSHATAQTIGSNGKIPIFDEFEKHNHMGDVLETAKSFNKGGCKTSGTTGAKSNSYEFHHLAWFGSIYIPRQIMQDAAQESRMVKLELKVLDRTASLLDKVDNGDEIASKIIAALIFNWDQIEAGAKHINKSRKEILDSNPNLEIRTIENFMYASSLLTFVTGDSYKVPEWASNKIEEDNDKILNAILSSILFIEGSRHSIIDCLEKARLGDQTTAGKFSKELENVGIKTTYFKGVNFLAIRHKEVSRFLLKDTEFKDLDIHAPLTRTAGAVSSHPVKFSGKADRCILIPMDYILNSGTEKEASSGECNQRNHSVTPSVTPYIYNNQRDIYSSYTSYAKHEKDIQDEAQENNELDLFDFKETKDTKNHENPENSEFLENTKGACNQRNQRNRDTQAFDNEEVQGLHSRLHSTVTENVSVTEKSSASARKSPEEKEANQGGIEDFSCLACDSGGYTPSFWLSKCGSLRCCLNCCHFKDSEAVEYVCWKGEKMDVAKYQITIEKERVKNEY